MACSSLIPISTWRLKTFYAFKSDLKSSVCVFFANFFLRFAYIRKKIPPRRTQEPASPVWGRSSKATCPTCRLELQ